MSRFFAVNELVRVKMSVQSSRLIHPGEIATISHVSISGRAALYDLQFGDGTVAKRVSPIALAGVPA